MKKTFYVYWNQWDWADKGDFEFWHVKVAESSSRFFLKEVELEIPEIELPTRDQIARLKVTALESERQAILAETHKKVAVIEEKIRQLSALTYQPQSEEL